MYTKEAHWTRGPSEVVRTVGSSILPSRPLIEYTLTTPGVHTAIIGIGQISDNSAHCQLEQNLSAAQVKHASLSAADRQEIEGLAKVAKEGKTNYFQMEKKELAAPGNVSLKQNMAGNERSVVLNLHTAFAGDAPVKSYEIWRDSNKIATVIHKPQTTKAPFSCTDTLSDKATHEYVIVAIDSNGQLVKSEIMRAGEMN